jgi:hypothetical protein
VEPLKVIKLLQSGKHYRLDGQDKLRLRKDFPEDEARCVEREHLVEQLA